MGAIEFVCDRESPVLRDEKCPFAIPTVRHECKSVDCLHKSCQSMTVIDCHHFRMHRLVVATVNLADCVALPFGSPMDEMRFSEKQVTCLAHHSMWRRTTFCMLRTSRDRSLRMQVCRWAISYWAIHDLNCGGVLSCSPSSVRYPVCIALLGDVYGMVAIGRHPLSPCCSLWRVTADPYQRLGPSCSDMMMMVVVVMVYGSWDLSCCVEIISSICPISSGQPHRLGTIG